MDDGSFMGQETNNLSFSMVDAFSLFIHDYQFFRGNFQYLSNLYVVECLTKQKFYIRKNRLQIIKVFSIK